MIEVVGGENLNRSLRAVRVSGTIRFIGLLAGLDAAINTYQFVTRHAPRPVLDQVYPFCDFLEALRRMESGRHFGIVVVEMPA